MKLVIFGLSVSSSWGNGHATLWRGLIAALGRLAIDVVFFERDTPYYAAERDLTELPGGELVLYPTFNSARRLAQEHADSADVTIITSYCPDAIAAADLCLGSRAPIRVFYDLDTPVTLGRLAAGERVEYIPPQGLGHFDMVLSFTGGAALDELRRRLGAKRAAPLYGSADPRIHRPAPKRPDFEADLSYLGTFAEDRRAAVEELLVRPAARLPDHRFSLGGSLYPADTRMPPNIRRFNHVAPGDHAAFYSSSKLTLNVTRASMAKMGYCPSGRLFEASACGCPIVSDAWEGLDAFFEPGREILVAERADDVIAALATPEPELAKIARSARERTLDEHTPDRRAQELLVLLSSVHLRSEMPAVAPIRSRGEAAAPSILGAERS